MPMPRSATRAVNLAARVAGRAAGGEILVSSLLKELAERAGFPQSTIVSVEAGLRERWDERVLERLATALGVTVDELANDRGQREQG